MQEYKLSVSVQFRGKVHLLGWGTDRILKKSSLLFNLYNIIRIFLLSLLFGARGNCDIRKISRGGGENSPFPPVMALLVAKDYILSKNRIH